MACCLEFIEIFYSQNNCISIHWQRPSSHYSDSLNISYPTFFSLDFLNKLMYYKITDITFHPNNSEHWILKHIFLHNHDVTTRPNKFSTNSSMFISNQAIFKCPLSAPQIPFAAGLSQLGKNICDRNMEKYYNCKI